MFKVFEKLKSWLGCLLLFAIAFVSTTLILVLKIEGGAIVTIFAIALGVILEYCFDPETLLLNFFGVIVLTLATVFLLTSSWSTSLFEPLAVLVSVGIVMVTATICVQWLIRNWIFSSFGFSYGLSSSAIAICLGITSSNLIFD